MTDQSQTLSHPTLKDLNNVTFSQALQDGLTHSNWLDGPGTEKCGQVVALASHLVSPEKAKELMTKDTFGPLFDGLSPNADLGQFLESRLRARMDVNGSLEYVLTWKRWDMESGPPICALRASVRRTSGKGFGGWPTPNTPNGGRKTPPGTSTTGKTPDGKKRQVDLQHVARSILGWPIPTDDDSNNATRTGGRYQSLTRTTQMAGWVSPTAQDHSRGSKPPRIHDKGIPLSQQVAGISGWATPAARDYRSESATDELNQARLNHPRGKPLSWQVAETANNAEYLLNPLFSLWLQGFPAEWAYCVVPEIQSILM